MTLSGWLGELDALPLHELAQQLQLTISGTARAGRIGPCPSCGSEQRGGTDRRPPIGYSGQRWRCHACGVAGGPPQLLQLVHVGEVLGRGDSRWGDVRRFAVEQFGLRDRDREDVPSWRRPYTPPPPPAPLPRPPLDEIRAVWNQTIPVTRDREISTWLKSRSLDPELIAERHLARALPAGGELPSWAGMDTRRGFWSWSRSGHRLLMRAVDEHGDTLSLRARSIRPGARIKTLSASAGPGSAEGLLYADGGARTALKGGQIGPPCKLIVTEGDPDWLTWSTSAAALRGGWGVVGIWSGSWTDAHARRLPPHSAVLIRTHHDASGDRYAAGVFRTLSLRHISVLRSEPPPPCPISATKTIA